MELVVWRQGSWEVAVLVMRDDQGIPACLVVSWGQEPFLVVRVVQELNEERRGRGDSLEVGRGH